MTSPPPTACLQEEEAAPVAKAKTTCQKRLGISHDIFCLQQKICLQQQIWPGRLKAIQARAGAALGLTGTIIAMYPCYLYLGLSIAPFDFSGSIHLSFFPLHSLCAVLACRESAHESERDCLKTPSAVLLLRAAAVSTLIFNVWQEIHRG